MAKLRAEFARVEETVHVFKVEEEAVDRGTEELGS